MWYEKYLLSLRENSKNLHETNYSEKIKSDDVVLIKNPIKPRRHWQLGRVVKLFHGEDIKINSVKRKRGDALTLKLFNKTSLTHDYHLISSHLKPDNVNSFESTVQPLSHLKRQEFKKEEKAC